MERSEEMFKEAYGFTTKKIEVGGGHGHQAGYDGQYSKNLP